MTEALRLWIDRTPSPIGELLIVADLEGRLRAIHWAEEESSMHAMLRRQYGEHVLAATRDPGGLTSTLTAYFEGALEVLDGMPIELAGTPFQRSVWVALRSIPCGTTLSYGALAQRIGRPSAVRAVGLANGANPIPVVVPCHRVVGSNGTLTGYGGGLERKRWLLAHEGALRSQPVLAL